MFNDVTALWILDIHQMSIELCTFKWTVCCVIGVRACIQNYATWVLQRSAQLGSTCACYCKHIRHYLLLVPLQYHRIPINSHKETLQSVLLCRLTSRQYHFVDAFIGRLSVCWTEIFHRGWGESAAHTQLHSQLVYYLLNFDSALQCEGFSNSTIIRTKFNGSNLPIPQK